MMGRNASGGGGGKGGASAAFRSFAAGRDFAQIRDGIYRMGGVDIGGGRRLAYGGNRINLISNGRVVGSISPRRANQILQGRYSR